LGYVTPVATVAKWFPDKKGLTTGMVIMGFGFGALLMSKVFAPLLYHWSGGNLVLVFTGLGIGFMVATTAVAALLCDPPPGYSVAIPGASANAHRHPSGPANDVPPGVVSLQFAKMWLVFFCNILAGLSIISFQSPLFQSLLRSRDASLSAEALAASGATLIAVSSLFNGLGRMFWGGLSDRMGRIAAFRFMLASQLAVFLVLPQVSNPWIFGGLICYVLLCYGGGFGTMPAFVLDVFGPAKMAVVYGSILTAWSAAGIAGPQMVAFLNDHYAQHLSHYAFLVNAAVLSLGLLFAMLLGERPRKGDCDLRDRLTEARISGGEAALRPIPVDVPATAERERE
jgi:OFA family oxalate/formate antiporter-like MFS transporter